MPIDMILRDQSLTDLYVQGKIERQASHSLLRALVAAMDDTFVQPLSRGFLPPSVLAAVLDSFDQTRIGRFGITTKTSFL